MTGHWEVIVPQGNDDDMKRPVGAQAYEVGYRRACPFYVIKPSPKRDS